ncbi:hypothetical protein ACFRFJ_15605 [Streptomyces hydrogenans]|uniref:hypothetical protein n=1 Tax=Streptomyces hydrogenans TaxID=1873719 RepID=UPI0036BC8679
MTREERHRILSANEIADARQQARKAIDEVGIPQELIDRLRPVLAPVAQALVDERRTLKAA